MFCGAAGTAGGVTTRYWPGLPVDQQLGLGRRQVLSAGIQGVLGILNVQSGAASGAQFDLRDLKVLAVDHRLELIERDQLP